MIASEAPADDERRLGGDPRVRRGAHARRGTRVRRPPIVGLPGLFMALGGGLLFVSLFAVWSHQFSPAVLAHYGSSSALRGVPRTPDAWQVYSAADVLLVLLAVALAVVAVRRGPGTAGRWVLAAALAVALAFAGHAASVPPTNGATLYDAAAGHDVDTGARVGPGETLALVALSLGMVGTLLSLGLERAARAQT